jgi:acetate kinase
VTTGRVLVLNAGSATLKATVLDLPSTRPLFEEETDWPAAASEREIDAAVRRMVASLASHGIPNASLAAVGHRVVHGGERFTGPASIDDETLDVLERHADLAPLHNPRGITTIRAARQRFDDIPHVAAFDTAFHSTLPDVARRYPVPDEWVERYGVRRYGFHGLSVEWSVRRAAELLEHDDNGLRLIVAHLGGGCSVTAVDGGRSVHTSMGMTPLEGLMMGTRAGSIDPGIIFRLMRSGVPAEEIEHALEHESGLLGVGDTADMRRLLQKERDGDRGAAMAIDMFVDRAAAGIAAAATALDAVDAVVFTGGIGEHAAAVRLRICARLSILGLPEPSHDELGTEGVEARSSSGIAVCVVHAREDVVIAEAALGIARR